MNVDQYLSEINITPDKLIPINTGLTNMVYQIDIVNPSGSTHLVMKRYHPSENNFTRARQELYERLTSLQLAPPITKYFQDGHVEQFVPGNIITTYQAGNRIIQLANNLGNYHRQAAHLVEGSVKLWEWIDNEYNALDEIGKKHIETYFGDIQDLPIQIRRMRRSLDNIDIPITICHNDLNLSNLLLDSNDIIHIIDWEWVGINPCAFDLAALVHHLHLGDSETETFCKAYEDSFQKITNLSTYLKMYLAPNRLWWGLWSLNRLKQCPEHSERWHELRKLSENCFLLYKSLLATYFPPTVYVVGVFDLLHLGHMNLLAKAKAYARGGKLIVGVHNDQLVESYKRTPLTTHGDRVRMVERLACVDQVIQNAPYCRDCNLSWYQKYGIDYHIAGENAGCYANQQSLGIFRILDSEYLVHTTDIIKNLTSRPNV